MPGRIRAKLPKRKQPKGRPKNPFAHLVVLEDPRKREVAQILALAGYTKGSMRRTGAVVLAARTAKVDPSTIYDWLDDQTFQDALDEVREEVKNRCLNSILRAIDEGDPRTSLEMLAILSPEPYDRTIARDLRKFAHEKEMLTLQKQDKHGDDRPLPVIVFTETLPGVRIAPPAADEEDD